MKISGLRMGEKHEILNFKTEYDRCAMPRLEVILGEQKSKNKDRDKMEEEKK